MKYLRKYNESIDQDDIVLNCLDLIDNGFEIQELSGGLSKFIFRLERRDTISLPKGVDLHNLDWDWLEENYPENMFYIIKDNYRADLYGYRIATENTDKEITESQRELLIDLVSITERLARYLRRDDIAAKISFTNMFRRDGGTINDICIDFLFEQGTKLIPKLESVVNKKDEYIEKLRWDIPKQGQMFIDLMKEEMAYLFDDSTWEVNMECGATAVITFQKRDAYRYIDTFRWRDVKDYLIPFLRRNKDDWKFFDFKWNDIRCKTGENVKIRGYSHATCYFTIEDLINDSDKLNQTEWIGGIIFKIKMRNIKKRFFLV